MRIHRIASAVVLAGGALVLLAMAQSPEDGNAGYNIQYLVHATEAGKPVLDRSYTLWLRNGGSDEVDTVRRVPINSGDNKINYQPIGLILSANLPRRGDANALTLDTHFTLSALVPGTPAGSPSIDAVSSNTETVVPLGQRVTISRFQTLASGREYEIDVLVKPTISPAH